MTNLRLPLAVLAGTIIFSSTIEARPHRAQQPEPTVAPRHCIDGACSAEPQASTHRASGPRARSFRARATTLGPTTILGGLPAACSRPKARFRWCGCAVALHLGIPNSGHWDLAANYFALPSAAPAPNMVVVRSGHVAVLKRHISGTIWMAYDPNSGQQLARMHPIDLRAYRKVVDPSRVRTAKAPQKTTQDPPARGGSLARNAQIASADPGIAVHALQAPPRPSNGESALALAEALDDARNFLIRIAVVSATMARLGRDQAIGHLHPTFARRLATALAEARTVPGLAGAACSSAYRPPAFGIGGYRNKFDSNHAYGLACDLAGIGPPGSARAKTWHIIATRHGLYNPYYGTRAWWEYNHYQVTPTLKAVAHVPALRKTITGAGPIEEQRMWRVADVLIDRQMGASYGPRRARKYRYAGLTYR